MVLISIEKISDKLSFNNYIESDTYARANLRCPSCRSNVSLRYKNLVKHAFSDITNLSDKVITEIKILLEQKELNVPNSFLDYNCPNCQNPIRIYYESWAGGKHGEAGFELKYAITQNIELVNWRIECEEQSQNVWKFRMVHQNGSIIEKIGTNLDQLLIETREDALETNTKLSNK